MNVDLEPIVNYLLIELLKESKDIFVWTYKDLKGIPPNIAQHRIDLLAVAFIKPHSVFNKNKMFVQRGPSS
jgi:hypothetical protein